MRKKRSCLLFLPPCFYSFVFLFLIVSQVYAERGVVVNPNDSQNTERRIALVIGNSAYKSSPLRNPVNDATDMVAELKRLGFQVSLGKDCSRKEMRTAILKFGQ